MTYDPKEFVAKLKTICYEKGITVRLVEMACGTTNGYYSTQLRCVTDYDYRKVAKFFNMSIAEFMAIKPYEIIKLPRMALTEKDFSTEVWAEVKKVLQEKKNANKGM